MQLSNRNIIFISLCIVYELAWWQKYVHLSRVSSNLVLKGHKTIPFRINWERDSPSGSIACKTTMTTIRKRMIISAIVVTTATATTISGVADSSEKEIFYNLILLYNINCHCKVEFLEEVCNHIIYVQPW